MFFFLFADMPTAKLTKGGRSRPGKLSNRLKRQRSPSPVKDGKAPAPRNPRRLAKAMAKKQQHIAESKEKHMSETESIDELKLDSDIQKESLSTLKGAFNDDDFDGFENVVASDSDQGIDDDEFDHEPTEMEEDLPSGTDDEVCC